MCTKYPEFLARRIFTVCTSVLKVDPNGEIWTTTTGKGYLIVWHSMVPIFLQPHLPLPTRFCPSENWLNSRWSFSDCPRTGISIFKHNIVIWQWIEINNWIMDYSNVESGASWRCLQNVSNSMSSSILCDIWCLNIQSAYFKIPKLLWP